jgi:cytochrome c-type biogenesis protein CcmH
MTLWLILAAMTAGTLALLLLPLVGHQRAAVSRAVLETAIYRDRLAEVKRDVERGLLTPAEAEAAEAEISRRMLAAAGTAEAQAQEKSDPSAGQSSRWVAATLVAAGLPLGAVVLYLAVGSPTEPGHPFAARENERTAADEHVGSDMEVAIQRLAERLETEPDNLEGWTLLARSYLSAGQYQEAAGAYRRAVDISGNRPDLAGAYGETLVAAAGGIVTPEARKVFEEISRVQPDNPGPKFYLGLARLQAGDGRGALEIWLALEAEAEPGTPWLPDLRENIERAAAEFDIDLASVAPSRRVPAGPTVPSAGDLAATQSMNDDEQTEMIRSMVARLAERLEGNPGDVEGWSRLGRSYVVLNEPEKAKSALARAVALDPANIDLVLSYADATLAAPDQIDPLPGESVGAMRDLLGRDAANPQALWYVGLSEAQSRNPTAAAALWGRLLVQLDPGTLPYETVKRRIDSLALTQ